MTSSAWFTLAREELPTPCPQAYAGLVTDAESRNAGLASFKHQDPSVPQPGRLPEQHRNRLGMERVDHGAGHVFGRVDAHE